MRILALDVGTKRIGVAFANTASARIAIPRGMIPVDGNELTQIAKQYRLEKAECIVSGLPRNNSGEETAQSQLVQEFIERLRAYFIAQGWPAPRIFLQDESLTSVQAEQNIAAGRGVNRKEREAGKVDAEAAAIILQDFIDSSKFNNYEYQLAQEGGVRAE